MKKLIFGGGTGTAGTGTTISNHKQTNLTIVPVVW